MNKLLAFAFLGIGFVLLLFGFVTYETATATMAMAMSDESTDMALWLSIFGLLTSITGAFSLATEQNNAKS